MKRIHPWMALSIAFATATPSAYAWKLFQKGELPTPHILVMPFPCDNTAIGQKMTQGLIESVDKKAEAMDLAKFELYLASYSLNVTPFLDMPTDPKLSIYISTEGPTPRFNGLIKEIFGKESLRVDFQKATQLDYLVVGKAQEKKLTALEAGNLQTAQTADMKMLNLKTGEVCVDESFKQGGFEIVAPDRIGKKFASAVNRELAAVRKREKELRKEEERKPKTPKKLPYSY